MLSYVEGPGLQPVDRAPSLGLSVSLASQAHTNRQLIPERPSAQWRQGVEFKPRNERRGTGFPFQHVERVLSKETYLAVLIRAAEAHSNWEVVADENGIPFAVRKKDKTAPGLDSPMELAEWFVETFPEEAADILSGEKLKVH